MNDVKQLRKYVDRQWSKRSATQDRLSQKVDEEKELRRSIRRHDHALTIVKQVGLKTQQQLQFHISDMVSMSLAAVFSNPYEFEVEFVERRDKTECDLSFVRNGNKVDPITASGCGAVDVASFALRVVGWSMGNPRSRNTIILDEPLRYLSQDNQEKASQMIQDISKKLGIQFIIVTQDETLASYADKTFKVTQKRVKKKNQIFQISKINTL